MTSIHKVLQYAFNLAVRWEYISKNSFLNATLPEHHDKERVILEPEQILKVLEFTNRPEYYDYYLIHCAVLITIGCTVRGGEIGGLQWDKINFEQQNIIFDRAINRVSKKNMDCNLTICQANGRSIMSAHLNKRFKKILTEMNDPDMDP